MSQMGERRKMTNASLRVERAYVGAHNAILRESEAKLERDLARIDDVDAQTALMMSALSANLFARLDAIAEHQRRVNVGRYGQLIKECRRIGLPMPPLTPREQHQAAQQEINRQRKAMLEALVDRRVKEIR